MINSDSRRNFTKKVSAFIGGALALSGINKLFGKTNKDNGPDSVLDSSPYIGEISLFPYNFAPVGWAPCNGQLLPISEYSALFNLIGTTYGGDGQQTFALPNLQSRVAIHQGQGSFSNYIIGEIGGSESVTLSGSQIPAHNHSLNVVAGSSGTSTAPAGNYPAFDSDGLKEFSNTQSGSMNGAVIKLTGGSLPHYNIQPSLAMTYCISLFGIYPSQG